MQKYDFDCATDQINLCDIRFLIISMLQIFSFSELYNCTMTVKIWYKIEELEETSINFEQNKTVDDLKKAIIKNEPNVLKDCTSSEISLKITKEGDNKIHIVSPRWVIQKVLKE